MIVAVWGGRDTVIDACGGLKIWGRRGEWYSKLARGQYGCVAFTASIFVLRWVWEIQ